MPDLSKYLDLYDADLDAAADKLIATTPEHVGLPDTPQPTQTHRNLVKMMHDIFGLVGSADGAHPMLRATLRTVRKLEPVALEELSRVPEHEVVAFMKGLQAMIDDAIGGGVKRGANRPGAAQSPATGAGVPGGGDAGR